MRQWRVVPREVRRALQLERSERVLVAAPDASDRLVVGTDRSLQLPGESSGPTGSPYQRIGWEEVERADWDRDAEILRIAVVAPFGEPNPVEVLRFEPTDVTERLLRHIRERVTASVVVDRHVPLQNGQGVRVVARRRLGDSVLQWSMVFDDGLEPSDPGVRDAAETALAVVRGEVEP